DHGGGRRSDRPADDDRRGSPVRDHGGRPGSGPDRSARRGYDHAGDAPRIAGRIRGGFDGGSKRGRREWWQQGDVMRIDVVGKRMEVTDAIREYAETKLGKLLRFFDGTQQISVVIEEMKHKEFAVEVVVDVVKHEDL